MKRKYALFIIVNLVLWSACKKEKTGSTCSYIKEIQPIIHTKCAITHCHNSGSTFGDFTNYAVLKSKADIGRLRTNVFELKIMPPSSVAQLTDAEKEKLKCWLDNGALQD